MPRRWLGTFLATGPAVGAFSTGEKHEASYHDCFIGGVSSALTAHCQD
jgi:hypothetical protein